MVKTVGELIKQLQQFDPGLALDIDASWYDRNNYCHAHRDIWCTNGGIELSVAMNEPGIVCISNENTKDVCLYD